jgi:hypothetical protein
MTGSVIMEDLIAQNGVKSKKPPPEAAPAKRGFF